MNHFWLFVHLLGFTMWLGGGVGAMFVAIAARSEDRAALAVVARSLATMHRKVIAPGAQTNPPGRCQGGSAPFGLDPHYA